MSVRCFGARMAFPVLVQCGTGGERVGDRSYEEAGGGGWGSRKRKATGRGESARGLGLREGLIGSDARGREGTNPTSCGGCEMRRAEGAGLGTGFPSSESRQRQGTDRTAQRVAGCTPQRTAEWTLQGDRKALRAVLGSGLE